MSGKINIEVRRNGDTVIVEWPYYVGSRMIWQFVGSIAFAVFFLWAAAYQFFEKANLLFGAILAAVGAFFLFGVLAMVFGKGFGRALRGSVLTQLVLHRDGKIVLPWASMRGLMPAALTSDRTWKEIVSVEYAPASQWGWKSENVNKTEPMQIYFTYLDGGRDVLMETPENIPSVAIARDYAAQIVAGVKRGLDEIGERAAQVEVLGQLVQDDLAKLAGSDENPRRRL